MKKIFFLLLLVVSLSPFFRLRAQNLSAEQTERLFKVSQLWGHATYFHPFLQYKKISFDSAFAAAVPKVVAAKTTEELAHAMNEWLSVLNDPITRAEISTSADKQKFRLEFQRRDSIGIINMSGSLMDWNYTLGQISGVRDSLKEIRGLVLDLRNVAEPIDWFFKYSGVEAQLFSGSIATLGGRSVAHSGFIPETGSTSGDYQTYFKIFPPLTIVGNRTNNIPTVFVASPSTVLPEVAWAMRNNGLAAVIGDGKLNDGQNALSYNIMEDMTVHLRNREPVGGDCLADVIMDKADDKSIIEKAIELIKGKTFTNQETQPEIPISLVNRKPAYPQGQYPSVGWRVLTAAKIYSVINYFFPNKKMMTVNWDSIARIYLPRFVAARDSAQYQLTVAEMYSFIQDGHGFNTVPVARLLGGGDASLPIAMGIVEEKLVVTAIINDSLAKLAGVEKGDVILKVNSRDVRDRVEVFKKYIASSNESSHMSAAAGMMSRGIDSTEGIFSIQKKNGKTTDIKLLHTKKLNADFWAKRNGRPDKDRLRFLTKDIGYADLNILKTEEVDSMFEMFKNTKAIVFDMRGYPHGTAWTISPRLTNKTSVPAAKFTRLDRDYPLLSGDANEIGEIETWTTFIQYIPKPNSWQYKGKTVMLIDENTVSQAEHTGLFFRAANGTLFIGSQTAGANGDVTNFTIPGNITMYFSGQTVWFPDGKQLQRIGLVPDIYVRPTIRGIRASRDEVLERAIEFLQKGK